MSAPVNRAVRTRGNAPTAAAAVPAPAMAAKATTRAAPAQAPAKSMRQLNKENEDLQAQVDQLTSSLQSVHAGKQAVKLSYEKAAQEKEALIAQLQGEIDAQKAGSERELSSVSSALSRATEEAREKASQAEEAQTALEKLNLRVNEYQACLERVGVNAVSLQEWTQRDAEKQQDVAMLEEQVQRAMNELKDTRKALEMDVAREEEFAKSIADMRAQLRCSTANTVVDPASDGEDTASDAGEEKEMACDLPHSDQPHSGHSQQTIEPDAVAQIDETAEDDAQALEAMEAMEAESMSSEVSGQAFEKHASAQEEAKDAASGLEEEQEGEEVHSSTSAAVEVAGGAQAEAEAEEEAAAEPAEETESEEVAVVTHTVVSEVTNPVSEVSASEGTSEETFEPEVTLASETAAAGVTDAAVCVASDIPALSDQDGDMQEAVAVEVEEAVVGVGEGEAMGEGGVGGATQDDEDEAACDQHFAALLVSEVVAGEDEEEENVTSDVVSTQEDDLHSQEESEGESGEAKRLSLPMNQHQILHPEIPSSSDEAEPAPTNAAVETSSKRLSAVADLLNPAPVDGTVADTEVVVDKPVFDKAAC